MSRSIIQNQFTPRIASQLPTTEDESVFVAQRQLPDQIIQQPTQPVIVQPIQPAIMAQQMVATAQPAMYVQGPQLQQTAATAAMSVQQVPQNQAQQVVHYFQQPTYFQPLAGGGVAYTAQPQPGTPQIVMNPGYFNQPDFNYTPNSYFIQTLTMTIICGIFSLFSLVCSIPAVVYSVKSKNSSKVGKIKQAKREGLIAVYLIITAILFAFITAAVFTGVMIPLYRTISYVPSCRYSSYCG